MIFSLLNVSSSTTETPNKNLLTEEEEINKVVELAYSSLSFQKGEEPDLVLMKSAFLDGANIRSYRSNPPTVLTIEGYIKIYGDAVAKGSYKAVVEKEIWGKTEVFGKIAHRISTYVTYVDDMNKIYERGVNSFQLVKTPDGWKINSLVYDTERQDQKIPQSLLSKIE